MIPKISICIPVFNNWQYTKNCINHLSNDDLKFLEIIIIDNLSNDDTEKEMIKLIKRKDNIKYVRNKKNLGFAGAVNLGILASQSENIMILNNDIIFGANYKKWIASLNNIIADNPNSLIGPTGGFVDPNNNFNFKYETNDNLKKINYMSGWCLFARKEIWKRLEYKKNKGPFDEETFFLYYEDTDLGFRAGLLGLEFKLIHCDINHIGKQTSKLIGINKYYEQSRYRFIKKWENKLIIQN